MSSARRNPRVEEQSQHRHVAPVGEVLALARLEHALDGVVAQHRHRCFGDGGRFHVAHGRLGDLALVAEPTKERLQRAVAVARGGGLVSRQQVGDERLDVLAPDCIDIGRHPGALEKVTQEPHGIAVGLDRARGLVL
jgi:hypothetical protein